MKCHDMPEMLVSLLYGEMDSQTEEKVRAHIRICSTCRAEWEELQGTTQLLGKWEDLSPDREHLFVEEHLSGWDRFIQAAKKSRWPGKLGLGIPLALGAALVLLSIMNFEAEYTDGQWHIAFGLGSRKSKIQDNAAFTAAVKQVQQETLLMVSTLLEESDLQQQQRMNAVMANYARDFEAQRQQDLRVMGRGLEGIHLTTQGQLQQNSQAINDLIRLANVKLDKK